MLHTSTPQHSVLFVHVASPFCLQFAAYWQVPALHVRPAQQSALLVHDCVLPRQVHTRVVVPSHNVKPQHSPLVVHDLPTP
jgi:hypothetical protein